MARKKYKRPDTLIGFDVSESERLYCTRILTGLSAIFNVPMDQAAVVALGLTLQQKGYAANNRYTLSTAKNETAQDRNKTFDLKFPSVELKASGLRVLDAINAANGYKRRIEAVIHALYFVTLEFENWRYVKYEDMARVMLNAGEYLDLDLMFYDLDPKGETPDNIIVDQLNQARIEKALKNIRT
jgi:hypothetical protein